MQKRRLTWQLEDLNGDTEIDGHEFWELDNYSDIGGIQQLERRRG